LTAAPRATLERRRPGGPERERFLAAAGGAHGARLSGVHPHLPAARGRLAVAQEAVRPAAAELGVAQAGDPAEDRGDPATRPSDRVLDGGKGARPVRRLGQLPEELAHQVAAAVVEALDLARLGHRVLRGVL